MKFWGHVENEDISGWEAVKTLKLAVTDVSGGQRALDVLLGLSLIWEQAKLKLWPFTLELSACTVGWASAGDCFPFFLLLLKIYPFWFLLSCCLCYWPVLLQVWCLIFLSCVTWLPLMFLLTPSGSQCHCLLHRGGTMSPTKCSCSWRRCSVASAKLLDPQTWLAAFQSTEWNVSSPASCPPLSADQDFHYPALADSNIFRNSEMSWFRCSL